MKKLGAVLIFLIALLIITGTTRGEDADNTRQDLKVYDLSQYEGFSGFTTSPRVMVSSMDSEGISIEGTRPDDVYFSDHLYDLMVGNFEVIDSETFRENFSFFRGKMYVKNKPELISELEKVMKLLIPEKVGYRLRFSVFRKKGFDSQIAAKSPTGSAKEIADKLFNSGYEKRL